MQTRPLLTAAILVSTTAALGPACAREPGTCADDLDCAFGQVCLVDEGLCAIGRDSGAPGAGGPLQGPMGGGDTGALGAFVTAFITPGRFEGQLGTTTLTSAEANVNVYEGGISAWFTNTEDRSQFVFVQTTTDLTTPGTRTITTGLGEDIIQACDTDVAYDEFFPSWELEVTPPREPTADDPIIAEDLPPVVDVTIDVGGEGSDVSVTFPLPVQ